MLSFNRHPLFLSCIAGSSLAALGLELKPNPTTYGAPGPMDEPGPNLEQSDSGCCGSSILPTWPVFNCCLCGNCSPRTSELGTAEAERQDSGSDDARPVNFPSNSPECESQHRDPNAIFLPCFRDNIARFLDGAGREDRLSFRIDLKRSDLVPHKIAETIAVFRNVNCWDGSHLNGVS